MFTKSSPSLKSLRYVFSFTSDLERPPYVQLKDLLSRNIIRVCVIQEEKKDDNLSYFRGFFTLQFPKSIEELGLYGALLKPSQKAHYVLFAMLKKHPFGETKVLRGPKFDLKNIYHKQYMKKKRIINTLDDLAEIEGEYRLNKKIKTSKEVNEEMLKDLTY